MVFSDFMKTMRKIENAESLCERRIVGAQYIFKTKRVLFGQKRGEFLRAKHECSNSGGNHNSSENIDKVGELAGVCTFKYFLIFQNLF